MDNETPIITIKPKCDYKALLQETVKFNRDTRFEDAEHFLLNMLDEPDYIVDAFIVNDIKAFFAFKTREELKIIKDFNKEARKTHYKLKNNEKNKNDLHIDKKYENMYTYNVYDSGRVNIEIHPDIISDLILSENNIITYKDSMFIFREGFYRYDEEYINDLVVKTVNDICKCENSNNISRKVNDIIKQIQTKSRSYNYPFNNHPDSIPVENGILLFDFKNKMCKLVEHNPKLFRFNYKIPISYNPTNESKVILDLIKGYTDEYIDLISIIAQSIMQAIGYGPYKKAYFIYGIPNTGKSTFLELLQKMIGKEMYSDVSFEQLNQRFQAAGLEGKLLNIHDDTGYFNLKDTGTFKTYTGKSEHQIERKGKDPYMSPLSAVHVFTTNTPAKYALSVKNDNAFWERVDFITFSKVQKIVADFAEKTFTDYNIEGFFNSIVEEILKVGKNKRLSIETDWFETREKWTLAGNPLYSMVKDLMETEDISLEDIEQGKTIRGTFIIKEELLKILQIWCFDKNIDTKMIPDSKKALTMLVDSCGWDTERKEEFIDGEHDSERHCYFIPYNWNNKEESIKYWTEISQVKEKDTRPKKETNNAIKEKIITNENTACNEIPLKIVSRKNIEDINPEDRTKNILNTLS